MVKLEMLYFYCPDFVRSLDVAHHAREWIETGNAHHIDAAVYLCALSGIAPPPTLAAEVAKVAERRINGTLRGGTADDIVKGGVLARALLLMLKLRAAGATLGVAASKAAKHIADTAAPFQYKASTLERYYSEKYRRGRPTLEAKYHKAWLEHPVEVQAQRQALLAALPEADDDLKGVAR